MSRAISILLLAASTAVTNLRGDPSADDTARIMSPVTQDCAIAAHSVYHTGFKNGDLTSTAAAWYRDGEAAKPREAVLVWDDIFGSAAATGFHAEASRLRTKRPVIAYRGTAIGLGSSSALGTAIANLKEDLVQFLHNGLGWNPNVLWGTEASPAPQDSVAENLPLYANARTFAWGVRKRYPDENVIVCTGHSLGGGLAYIGGAAISMPVVTYNPARLSGPLLDAIGRRYEEKISKVRVLPPKGAIGWNFRVAGDKVSESAPVNTDKVLGLDIGLVALPKDKGMISPHYMSAVINSLAEMTKLGIAAQTPAAVTHTWGWLAEVIVLLVVFLIGALKVKDAFGVPISVTMMLAGLLVVLWFFSPNMFSAVLRVLAPIGILLVFLAWLRPRRQS